MDADLNWDFKETEVGLVPIDWDVTAIGALIDDGVLLVQNGFSCSNRNQDGKGLPHLRPMNVDGDGHITLEELNYVETDRDTTRYLLQLGDVVFNNTNSETLVGKTAYWNREGKFALSNHMTIIRVLQPEQVNSFYLAVFLHKLWYDGYSRSICRRYVNQAGIGIERIRNIPVLLPPLPEQRRIAAVLNAIQEDIAAQEDVIAEAREFKRSLMQRLFTYGPSREPAETRETPYGEVPARWRTMLLEECAYVQTGTAKGRRLGDSETITVPYLRVANVQDGYLDLSEIKQIEIKADEFERYSLKAGDVLMTEGGDFDKLGRGFIWNEEIKGCIHQNHVFAVRVDKSILVPEYLAYLGQSTYGKAYFVTVAHRTTNLASINSTKLKKLPVLVPPKVEQDDIVGQMQAVDLKIAAEEDRKAALQELFKSTLHQLMTGQIRLLGEEDVFG